MGIKTAAAVRKAKKVKLPPGFFTAIPTASGKTKIYGAISVKYHDSKMH